jgi:hypothetical protein
MYPKNNDLPSPIADSGAYQSLDSLDDLALSGDINESPFNVFIGHNLGHRVFTMSVPFRKFSDISAVANDRDRGPVAQRQLDEAHAKKLAAYMVKGLVSAAKLKRIAAGKEVPPIFDQVLRKLGEQPYFSLQPLVCNIRDVPLGGGIESRGGIRGLRLETKTGETAGFRVFLAERHVLWVVDGQHRRAAADLVMSFLDQVRRTGKYPSKGAVLFAEKGANVQEEEMTVWNEAYDAARSFATLTVEVHLGLNIDQERQLFHDLNRLAKKVDSSLAFQFDASNPITAFIKNKLREGLGVAITETEPKEWANDTGALVLKDLVAINAIAFLNKGNVVGATPSIIEPREEAILDLWAKITEIPDFGSNGSKEKTVAAQPVVLKALAKIAFDLNFSNRRPANAPELYTMFLERLPSVNFSHSNPMWNYYSLADDARVASGLEGLGDHLPATDAGVNRDVGSKQGEFMRFGAKHNDIYPILSDMIRWATGLPSRHTE